MSSGVLILSSKISKDGSTEMLVEHTLIARRYLQAQLQLHRKPLYVTFII